MKFPSLDTAERISFLTPPAGRVRAVLDTDTYNEIDDQFALTHAVLSPDRIGLEAVYAAPFFNAKSISPADGMEKSYEEILRLLDRLDRSASGFVFKGSTEYLENPDSPVRSAAAEDLVSRALDRKAGPLYVIAIGAITNVASAILLEPRILSNIVIIWLGGNASYWPRADEFNLKQDVYAAQVVFDSGAALVRIPCKPVTSHLHTTVPEVERYVAGRGPIGDYLAGIFKDHVGGTPWKSKVVWDIAATSWLVEPAWVSTALEHCPILTSRLTFSRDSSRHLVREAFWINRDAVFTDVYRKLESFSKP